MAAQNTKLDAPVSRKPTVRSEITRGHQQTIDCFVTTLSTPAKYIECVDGAVNKNIAESTLSDAYMLGLYVTAVSYLKVLSKFLDARSAAIDRDMTPKALDSWSRKAKDLSTKSGLTVGDYCQVISTTPSACEAHIWD